jgi:hypothetical protein
MLYVFKKKTMCKHISKAFAPSERSWTASEYFHHYYTGLVMKSSSGKFALK